MITSPDNPKLKLARRLAARSARDRQGAFFSEGEDLLEAGLGAGWEPIESLVRAGSGLPGEEVEPGLLDRLSTLGSGTRALTIWRRPEVAAGEGPYVFCDAVGDPANVGAIARSAAGLWGAALAVGPGTADPWGPRAVRASMGAVFSHPPVPAPIEETPAPRVGLVAHGGAGPEALAASGARTLCVGAERAGLSDSVLEACAEVVTIALHPGAESLNVAAAAAIALHRLSSPASAGDQVEAPQD